MEKTYSYTGAPQLDTLSPGKYKLQCWGAKGGDTTRTAGYFGYGGKPGYSEGILNIIAPTNIFVYVGQKGNSNGSSASATSFGGGGTVPQSTLPDGGSSGGGASDIRIGTDQLDKRVIVAGGGGGSTSYNLTYWGHGGNGGGLTGGNGSSLGSNATYGVGGGGTQTAGGQNIPVPGTNVTNVVPGTFGAGGVGPSATVGAGGRRRLVWWMYWISNRRWWRFWLYS